MAPTMYDYERKTLRSQICIKNFNLVKQLPTWQCKDKWHYIYKKVKVTDPLKIDRTGFDAKIQWFWKYQFECFRRMKVSITHCVKTYPTDEKLKEKETQQQDDILRKINDLKERLRQTQRRVYIYENMDWSEKKAKSSPFVKKNVNKYK